MDIKVKNMISKAGNEVANQFILNIHGDIFFQSYDSLIVLKKAEGGITLDEKYWNYSVTTNKYRRQFLGEGIEETRRKIESGIYELADLNE
jgi:hypothetical protein